MQQLALEIMQTREIRPFPVVQRPLTRDEDVTRIRVDRSIVLVLDLELPLALMFVPTSLHDPLFQLDVLHATVFPHHSLPVLMDFLSAGIELRPFTVGLKCGLVGMRGNIWQYGDSAGNLPPPLRIGAKQPTTGTSRIAILIPGTTNIGIFFVDAEIEVLDALRESNAGGNAGNPSSHDHYPDWTVTINRSVLDDILLVGSRSTISIFNGYARMGSIIGPGR
jgi:hypothetical protein